jgi:hypothetical protein
MLSLFVGYIRKIIYSGIYLKHAPYITTLDILLPREARTRANLGMKPIVKYTMVSPLNASPIMKLDEEING